MTAIQLLLLNLLYDTLCIVLPWDLVDPEDYRKPREWSGKHWKIYAVVWTDQFCV